MNIKLHPKDLASTKLALKNEWMRKRSSTLRYEGNMNIFELLLLPLMLPLTKTLVSETNSSRSLAVNVLSMEIVEEVSRMIVSAKSVSDLILLP